MKATLTLKQQDEFIVQFIDLFRQGVEAWIKAGEILVELVENDPHVYDEIIERCPTLNAGILGRFEQMGRKTLHPQLLLSASPGFDRLRKLPFSLQERYVSEPVPVVVNTQHGTDILLIKAKDMTKEQASQVFAGNRIRTEGEQKALLAQQESAKAAPAPVRQSPYLIKGRKVEFREPIVLTASELAAILAQIR
jgi:hypothetical protein